MLKSMFASDHQRRYMNAMGRHLITVGSGVVDINAGMAARMSGFPAAG
jgi:hypothetical protein